MAWAALWKSLELAAGSCVVVASGLLSLTERDRTWAFGLRSGALVFLSPCALQHGAAIRCLSYLLKRTPTAIALIDSLNLGE